MRRRSFVKRRAQNEEMSLQITSMADIFTILLVFLLKSYASGVAVDPSGVQLPQAAGKSAQELPIQLYVNQSEVLLDGHPVMNIRDFQFSTQDLESTGASRRLRAALAEKVKERDSAPSASHLDVSKPEGKIVVLADERAPYETIKTVLASAAVQGFTDVKLAVASGE